MKITLNKPTSKTYVVTQGPRGPAGPAGPQGPAGPALYKLSDVHDIDTSLLANGAVLVYNQQSNTWKSTTNLNSQAIDAGEF